MSPNIRFIDLFAGIGGFRLAAESTGAQCVFSSEWDQHSQKTYHANHGDKPEGDITKIPNTAIPDFDLLCAGFPCQPFSSIGKRQGFEHETQGTLFYEIVRILKEKRPAMFLLENVEGLVNHDKGRTFQTILQTLACSENGIASLLVTDNNLNYHVFWSLLNAKDFGLPQSRKRIFIVGFDAEQFTTPPNFSFPNAYKKPTFIAPFIETGIQGYSISKHLQKNYLFKIDDGRPQIVDQNSHIQVKTLVSTYHKIQRLTGTFVRDEQSETGIRLLSENECKAIMGFPVEFEFPVSRTQMYRQLGNSVAVNTVIEVIKKMQHAITEINLVDTKLNQLKKQEFFYGTDYPQHCATPS